MNLDVFELCSDQLQNKLLPMRAKFKAADDKVVEEAAKKGQPELKKPAVKKHDFWFPEDMGSNNSGFYELQAVLTHKGRSSNSGHYLGWVRGKKANEWFKCDDEEVTQVTEEEVLKLSGGGELSCLFRERYIIRLVS